jgi:predicted Rossmann-fold nucleotide-binding protein
MKFYVASSLKNRERAAKLIEELLLRGHTCTYDWTLHGSVAGEFHRYREVAHAEITGVKRADVVIALFPGGFGTHCEFGAALALGKRVVMVVDDESMITDEKFCIFHHHPMVKDLIVGDSENYQRIHESIDEAL